jgi:coenzyme F420-0:L-glutamate ligase/coenzyme F420-1:gamma-L-glutamate ligase
MRIEITGLRTLPEIRPGHDLAAEILAAARREALRLDSTVIVAVAQKVVSKAEGAVVDLRAVVPSPLAVEWAEQSAKDARLIELVLRQAYRIVKMDRGVLIAETRHGLVCANAGVDQSNVEGPDFATVLPVDPDASARRLRDALACGAVLVTDTFGRPWREGLVNVAIGVAGLDPLQDERGTVDRHGRVLASTIIAVADELAAAAGLAMRKSAGTPVTLISGFDWNPKEGSASALVRAPERDLFR